VSDGGPLRVEITGAPRGGAVMVSVGGHVLPVTAGTLTLGESSRFADLNVTLPIIDGLVVSLDANVSVCETTKSALVAMGWVPPGEPPAFIAKASGG
jgi:hypothetical protein